MNISVEKLRPGMRLAQNLYENKNSKYPLIPKIKKINDENVETILDENLIQKIKDKNISYVQINISKDIKETISNYEQDEVMNALTNTMHNITDSIDLKEIVTSAEVIASKIMNTDDYLAYSLASYTLEEPSLYKHALNVCQFAVSLAKIHNRKAKKEEVDIKKLSVAAILHEIGQVCKDKPEMLQKIKLDASLKQSMFPGYDVQAFEKYNDNMKNLYAFAMIKKNEIGNNIDNSLKMAVLLNGEDEIGMGPLKTTNETLSKLGSRRTILMARIIHISDMYEMLVSKIMRSGYSPNNIVEIMNQLIINKRIDPNLGNLFLHNIPLYSIGTRVRLSNGMEGIVSQINSELIDRPVIKLDNDALIDLSKSTTIIINNICEYSLDMAIEKNDLDDDEIIVDKSK